MNIFIPHSWLKDYLKTKATPEQVSKYLSLHSQSVEKIIKKENDWIYEIEITTNRSDCLSIYGIAKELSAILPQVGIKAKIKKIFEKDFKITKPKKSLPLAVQIKDSSLCPRFTAIIFDNITIKPSPQIIQNRLEKVGIRALNNVIDISNYLMIELGQPMHVFDYDKILGGKMILRLSKNGERIKVLDGKTRVLPEKAIIIEDGKGRIIDLCGIMGGKNSEVDQKTKRVLLFVQTYDPVKIRQTCQALAFRTEAASRFEKGVDPEGVIPAIKKAINMFEKNIGATIASSLIDIYPNPLKVKKVLLSTQKLSQLMGIKLNMREAQKILENLGFNTRLRAQNNILEAKVPHWRYDDIAISEDLVEEVARIYGYHNLPTSLVSSNFPKKTFDPFFWEEKTRDILKYLGFTEVYNYSFISKDLLKKTGFDPKNYLQLLNPLTSDWQYMRPSLIPGMLKTVSDNQSREEQIKIFELSHVYFPKIGKLPQEKLMVIGAITEDNFYQAKGIVESLLAELGIKKYQFKPLNMKSPRAEPVVSYDYGGFHPPKQKDWAHSSTGKTRGFLRRRIKNNFYNKIFHPYRTAEIYYQNTFLGILGEIDSKISYEFDLEKKVIVFDLDFENILMFAKGTKKYTPLPKYPAIIEDLAFLIPERTLVGEMIEEIKKVSQLITKVDLLDSYKNIRTFRITYQHPAKTLTDKEVKKEREKIIKKMLKQFGAEIK